MQLGVVDVPLYPNLPPDQVSYILRDAGAVVVFVSSADQAAKITEIRGEVPALRHVISFNEGAVGADMTISALETKGAAVDNRSTTAALTRGDA